MNSSYLNIISTVTKQSEINSNISSDINIFSKRWTIEKIDNSSIYDNKMYELKLIKRNHPRSVHFSDNISIQQIEKENIIDYKDRLDKYGNFSRKKKFINQLLLKLINNKTDKTYFELRKDLEDGIFYGLVNLLLTIYIKLLNNENAILYSHYVIFYPRHFFLIEKYIIDKTDIRERIATIIRYYRKYKLKKLMSKL